MDAHQLATLPLETLQSRLQQAQDAQHQLMLGKKAVSVGKDGSRVDFTQADSAQLSRYISALQSAIATKSGASVRRGPIYLGVG
ncbi:MAG: phage tail protein [Roseovarius sp.]|nr:phage tail protein [Roseovarius sp.]